MYFITTIRFSNVTTYGIHINKIDAFIRIHRNSLKGETPWHLSNAQHISHLRALQHRYVSSIAFGRLAARLPHWMMRPLLI
jgi:hypothetical protein